MKLKKLKNYKILAFVSICAIFLLQIIWTYKTYNLYSASLVDECNRSLEASMFVEAESRLQYVNQDSTFEASSEDNPTELNISYINDGIYRLSKHDISLLMLSKSFQDALKKKDINSDFQIHKIDVTNNKELETFVKGNTLFFAGAIETDTIPIRIDKSIGIQVSIMNPLNVLWQRMGLVIIASLIFSIIIIMCITKQIQIIAKQRRIAKIKSDFSYAMIHDMKSPISSILIGLEKEESNIGEEEKKHYRTLVKDEATHLLTLTKKLLTIAKAEEGRLEIEKTAVELQPMVEAIAEKYKIKAQKPIKIDVELKEPVVLADEEYLAEAISNLVDNAVKYSKDESAYIKISSSFDNKYSCIRVYDEGIGIAESDQKKIFDKFERAAAGINHTRRGGAAGFGLGLSYVAKVVEAHGGYISLESKKGKYSEFSIYLPSVR